MSEVAEDHQDEDAAVHAAAEYAYKKASEIHGIESETAHRERVCREVAAFMVEHLVTLGTNAEKDDRGYHAYVHKLPSGRIADATWQQFLDPGVDAEDAPKILIGTREEVIERARAHGVTSESDLALWEERETPPPGGRSLQIVVPPEFLDEQHRR